MFKLVPIYVFAVFVLAAFNCRSAVADGMRYRAPVLPERHVIEKVQPPYSGNFIINGTRFVGRTRACLRWIAGERIGWSPATGMAAASKRCSTIMPGVTPAARHAAGGNGARRHRHDQGPADRDGQEIQSHC